MNVIDYIAITCNLKKCPITDYIRLHEKCNRLQPITITNYDYPMSASGLVLDSTLVFGTYHILPKNYKCMSGTCVILVTTRQYFIIQGSLHL